MSDPIAPPVDAAAPCSAPFVAYVAGFLFDAEKSRVALIRKSKPAWQRGKLNGIGGKIEAGESAIEAMIREFREETGHTHEEWRNFLEMGGPDWSVSFFAGVGDVDALQSAEPEETVEWLYVITINPMREDMIENLPWLIPLALDCLNDGRPHFVEAHYP